MPGGCPPVPTEFEAASTHQSTASYGPGAVANGSVQSTGLFLTDDRLWQWSILVSLQDADQIVLAPAFHQHQRADLGRKGRIVHLLAVAARQLAWRHPAQVPAIGSGQGVGRHLPSDDGEILALVDPRFGQRRFLFRVGLDQFHVSHQSRCRHLAGQQLLDLLAQQTASHDLTELFVAQAHTLQRVVIDLFQRLIRHRRRRRDTRRIRDRHLRGRSDRLPQVRHNPLLHIGRRDREPCLLGFLLDEPVFDQLLQHILWQDLQLGLKL